MIDKIEATELRIGNLVYFEQSNDYKLIRPVGYSFFNNYMQYLTPIPLTPEILEKAGFYQLPHFTVGNSWLIDFGLSSQISISYLGEPNLMIWLSSVDKDKKPTDLVCIWNWDVNGEIYVHQLQNLYYSLTQTELKITL